ncbi:MAG: glycosyltransferase family 2 protein [Candidatus Moranbacteria bacterium]|nr:glycosyltransferase family 2 protein [Candidatus Moranbacteria bacterium]
MKTTLVIFTLNEVDGMKAIMPQIKKEWYDQLLVVDGGSTDGTLEYCREKGYPFIIQKQKGLRHAYVEALPHIQGDVMITFSPDGNSLAEKIPPLVEKMKEGYDMVIVSRYAEGAKSADDDFLTGFGNWMFTALINVCFRAKYTDSFVIFRAYKKNLIHDLDLDKDSTYTFEENLLHTKVGIEPLLSIRCAKRKLKVADIPGDEPKRLGGERKLQAFRWGAAYLIEIFRDIFYWR